MLDGRLGFLGEREREGGGGGGEGAVTEGDAALEKRKSGTFLQGELFLEAIYPQVEGLGCASSL